MPMPSHRAAAARQRRATRPHVHEQLADALAVLRAERSRAAAVRGSRRDLAAWSARREGETLGDVLRRPEVARRNRCAHLLIALERAPSPTMRISQAAIDDACAALERYIGDA